MSVERTRRAAVETFAHELVIAAVNFDLHGEASAHVQAAIDACIAAFEQARAAGVPMPLQLQVDDRCIHCDGRALRGPSLQARMLLLCCAERQVAGFTFEPGVTAAELRSLLALLLRIENVPALSRRYRRRALESFGVRHIHVHSREIADPVDRDRRLSLDQVPALRRYQELANVLQNNHRRALHDQGLQVAEANGVVAQALLQLDEEPSLLLSLASHDEVDRFTVGHSVRVALLALQVARSAGIQRHRLVDVGTAALLHDIGKSKVPQEVLFKQGPLDEGEWAWMAQHPRLGAQILIEQPDLNATAVGAAFCHHMGPGRGYPAAAFPFQPSSISRLIRVCDVFEALTAQRPYKRALSPCEAYAVMFRRAEDFDPAWLRYFARVIGIFPIGTSLVLDDGSEGLVVAHGPAPHQPVVRLLQGPDGALLTPDAPDRITVGMPIDGVTRQIASVMTHDREVQLAEPGEAQPWLTTTVAHACFGPPAPGH